MPFTAENMPLVAAGGRQILECNSSLVIARFQDGTPALLRVPRDRGVISPGKEFLEAGDKMLLDALLMIKEQDDSLSLREFAGDVLKMRGTTFESPGSISAEVPVPRSDGMQPSTTLSTNTDLHSCPLAEWIVERIR